LNCRPLHTKGEGWIREQHRAGDGGEKQATSQRLRGLFSAPRNFSLPDLISSDAAQVVFGLDARRRRGTARRRRAACIPLKLQAASRLGGGCGNSSDAPHSEQAKTIFSTSSMEQLTVLMTIGRGG
jgi:hypothetical protein